MRMTKDVANAGVLALTIIGAVICFALGQKEGGMVLAALAAGHVIPSPFGKPKSDP